MVHPSKAVERGLGGAALLLTAVSFVVSLLVVPPDVDQGDVQRLMYIHVPSAWLAYASFLVVFIASVVYLRTRRTRWDRLAHAAAEIGVLFTALTIGLGMIWAKPVWGVWWTWDPRLTTTTILLLIYLGYLAVRRLPDEPSRRASWAAVVGIVGFVDVPIVHLSVTWWRSLHQPATVLRPGAPAMDPPMLMALLLGLTAASVVFAYLLILRLHVHRLEEAVTARIVADRMFTTIDEREVVRDA
jgi:heme exporter protein C